MDGSLDVDVDRSADPQVSNGEVRLGRYEYPVQADRMTTLNLARFQNKTTFGDYSFDSDPLLSAEIFSSFTGGMGNETIKEGVDDDSFWEANLETRFPDGATLLPLTKSFSAPAGDPAAAFGLGDFPAADPTFYASFDEEVHNWNETTQAYEAFTTLPHNPVAVGVEFDDLFFIPMGANGFATMDAAGAVVDEPTVHVVHFIIWDRKLAALTTEGYILIRAIGDVAFPAPHADRTLPAGSLPRKLVDFINQRGDPTIHIVTNNRVFAYDPDGDVLYNTRLNYPKHPNQGLGAANWRGDTMFVSIGLGIHGYNGSLITSMGPDGRHGLPARHRGRIIDLLGEYNALLAMVEGVSANLDAVDEEYIVHTPMYRDRDTYAISSFTLQPVFSSILRWSNSQWHKVWESPDASGIPSWMQVSEASGQYRLWWGYGNKMYTQKLPITSQNPKQYLRSGEQEFMPTGSLISGWFDADMAAFDKLALHLEVNLEDVTGFNDCGGSVSWQYQTNADPSWRSIGVADTVGRTILPFAYLPRDEGNPFSKGRAFVKIRFRFTYTQKMVDGEYVINTSPLMTSAILKFIKIPESQMSWTLFVPLTTSGGFKGEGNHVLGSYLDYLLTSRELVEFGTNDEIFRVRVAQVSANKGTGHDEMGTYTVNLVEVRMGEDRPNTVTKYVDMAS